MMCFELLGRLDWHGVLDLASDYKAMGKEA